MCIRDRLEELRSELVNLHVADPLHRETTLLIHPWVLADFVEYNDFLEVCEAAVADLGLEGELQIASFHPHYQFAGTQSEDIENYTNRSPHPTLHLLREASIERALSGLPDPEEIYRRIDFPWMLESKTPAFCHGWTPERGFITYLWSNYSEASVLYLLAIGSPTHPVPASSWYAWTRNPNVYGCLLYTSELFVHRNIANVVVHTDLNCLSVMQFAVDVLKVKHIIVCGHYGCSGVRAALRCDRVGLADNWLRHVQDVGEKHKACVHALPGDDLRTNRLCELNVIEQVCNVCQTTIAHDAWDRKQPLSVHGWIYDLKDGLIRHLGMTISSGDQLEPRYRAALAAISSAVPPA